MKRDKLNVVLVFIFLIGLSVMLYPIVSNYWNSRTQTKAVATYSETVEDMSAEECDRMFAEAEAYNERLSQVFLPYTNCDQAGGYEDVLDITGTGIMGYITIDKIRVELPIYHGISKGVLQVAAGHLEGSSLPTGGKGTHCVLSAHRGLPSANLFTDLDEMEIGDTFRLTVLNRNMTYEVDQIRIVEPYEVENLMVDPEKDYCTLVTCTPYGINSHRLLVRGVRTANTGLGEYIAADAVQVNTIIVTAVIAIIILFFILLAMLVWQSLTWRKEEREKNAGKGSVQLSAKQDDKKNSSE